MINFFSNYFSFIDEPLYSDCDETDEVDAISDSDTEDPDVDYENFNYNSDINNENSKIVRFFNIFFNYYMKHIFGKPVKFQIFLKKKFTG